MWSECFRVFRTAAIMLDLCNPAMLDAYRDLLKRYRTRYGTSVWHLLCQADVRA